MTMIEVVVTAMMITITTATTPPIMDTVSMESVGVDTSNVIGVVLLPLLFGPDGAARVESWLSAMQ